jgi:hypothetical protein
MSATWEELELPVLRWVLEQGEGTGPLSYGSSEPFDGIPELTQSQVAEAIKRLQHYGLVARNEPMATGAYEEWNALRPTANGRRVLGEWPPAEGATLNVALARILRALADSDQLSDKEDKTAARRTAGTVASTAGEVVLDVVKDEMARLVADASS